MIHFLTVHWQSTRWIDPQLDYIRRHTRADHRVVAALDPAIPAAFHGRFTGVLATPIPSHAEKLNLLAEVACREAASDDDWLVFIDSDCFPIADWVPRVGEHLRRYALAAVRRDENAGDRQPHPSFAVTTVGFWKRIRGDWSRGHDWTNRSGRSVTDVGGNLLKLLEDAGVEWLPLLRSNRIDRHKVFFGVYDGIVYHHGAGSSPLPSCRADRDPDWQRRFLQVLGLYDRHVRRRRERNGRISEEIFQQLVRDPEFARQFMASRMPR